MGQCDVQRANSLPSPSPAEVRPQPLGVGLGLCVWAAYGLTSMVSKHAAHSAPFTGVSVWCKQARSNWSSMMPCPLLPAPPVRVCFSYSPWTLHTCVHVLGFGGGDGGGNKFNAHCRIGVKSAAMVLPSPFRRPLRTPNPFLFSRIRRFTQVGRLTALTPSAEAQGSTAKCHHQHQQLQPHRANARQSKSASMPVMRTKSWSKYPVPRTVRAVS